MIFFWKRASDIRSRIFIPKFYDPGIRADHDDLTTTHDLVRIGDLVDGGQLRISTGDEIGKAAYGTGDIPFVRTSDISNWETKSAPKQGVSEEIFAEYAAKQDVQTGDILLVRDGTYLIGTNCFITALDRKMLYQSHILKLRVTQDADIDARLLFLALNSRLVRRQIRSFQFTADTIDTIGNRYLDIVLAFPKDRKRLKDMIAAVDRALQSRVLAKAFVKQAPFLIEQALQKNSGEDLEEFLGSTVEEIEGEIRQDTVSAEFGHFETFWHSAADIRDQILLPKYYDPEIRAELSELSANCDCVSIGDLVTSGVLEISTGDEIGKMAYGTGTIPFLRTSDFANWEIKHDPKQGVSEKIYEDYRVSQDIRCEDILVVRDGTYLVGSSCMITEDDVRSLYCGGLLKIRTTDHERLDPYLLLGLLNSYIVKRQIRTKQFTRDVIDTLGQRMREVVLPIPKSSKLRGEIADAVRDVINNRVAARKQIASLAFQIDSASAPSEAVDIEELDAI